MMYGRALWTSAFAFLGGSLWKASAATNRPNFVMQKAGIVTPDSRGSREGDRDERIL